MKPKRKSPYFPYEKRVEKFWRQVNKSPGLGPNGDCWIWTGTLTSDGYGAIYVLRNLLGTYKAHRVSFYINNGTLNKNLVIMHSCDNRKCVNPNHLSEGTLADNNRDMQRKWRHNYQGETLLTEELIIKLRKCAPYITISTTQLADRLKISRGALNNALIGKTFSDLPGAIPRRLRGRFKATIDEVRAIRQLRKDSALSAAAIIKSLKLKLAERTVHAIINYESWKNV